MFGDVNSTVACALAAVKLGVPVVHVEAGLRSFDRTMPEEINRMLTDAVADLLLVSEQSGIANLPREGVAEASMRLVGNVMIDTLLRAAAGGASAADARRRLGLDARRVRASSRCTAPPTWTTRRVLGRLVLAPARAARRELPLVFPVAPAHARGARGRHRAAGLEPGRPACAACGPQPYLDSALAASPTPRSCSPTPAACRRRRSVLGVPCLTLRDNTERPVTVELGTSRLVGNDAARIRTAFADVRAGRWRKTQPIPDWDGRAGERVARGARRLAHSLSARAAQDAEDSAGCAAAFAAATVAEAACSRAASSASRARASQMSAALHSLISTIPCRDAKALQDLAEYVVPHEEQPRSQRQDGRAQPVQRSPSISPACKQAAPVRPAAR